jgi:hypothetical protein
MGLFEEAEAHAVYSRITHASTLIPYSIRSRAKLSRLKKNQVNPAMTLIGHAEKAYEELQSSMWLELSMANKALVSDARYVRERERGASFVGSAFHMQTNPLLILRSFYSRRYFDLVTKQLDAGVRSGKTDSFFIALACMSRAFATTGDLKQANRFQVMSEQYLPSQPSPLVEGWADFTRGDVLCGSGEFGEGKSYLAGAADLWFEGGHFRLCVPNPRPKRANIAYILT